MELNGPDLVFVNGVVVFKDLVVHIVFVVALRLTTVTGEKEEECEEAGVEEAGRSAHARPVSSSSLRLVGTPLLAGVALRLRSAVRYA